MQVCFTADELILSQTKYVLDIINHAHMQDCKSMGTPMIAQTKDSLVMFPNQIPCILIVLLVLSNISYLYDQTSLIVSILFHNLCIHQIFLTIKWSNTYFITYMAPLTLVFILVLNPHDLYPFLDTDWAYCP